MTFVKNSSLKSLVRISMVSILYQIVSSSSGAESQVIYWRYFSTNYQNTFGAPAPTNTPVNIVAASPSYFSNTGFIGVGLRDDGAVLEEGPYHHVSGTNYRSDGVIIRSGLSNVVAIANSTWALACTPYTLALKSDGKVVNWNRCPGLPIFSGNPPVTLSNVVAVSAGFTHSLALKTDGTAWSQLDPPSGLSNVVAISAGAYHNLALRSDGTVVAWGDNSYSQATVPAGLSNVVAIAGGHDHSLAIKADGKVVAWGGGSGYGTAASGLSNIAVIASGSRDVALKADGTVLAWENRPSAPIYSLATNAISIASGYEQMAILGDGLPRSFACPMKLTVPYGIPLILPSTAGGVRSLKTQWSFDGVELPGATNMALAIAGADFTNTGIYSVTVSNWYGTVTNFYTITVVPFLITTQPQSLTVNRGSNVTFTVIVSGVELGYQWRFNGTNLLGATNSTLTLSNAMPSQAGLYSVVVCNGYATNASSSAMLGFYQQPPSFNAMQSSLSARDGFSLQLTNLTAHGPVVIYASANLIDWLPIFTNPPVGGEMQFTDSSATNGPMRFYRAKEE